MPITAAEQKELYAIEEAIEELGDLDTVRALLKGWLPGDHFEIFQTGRDPKGYLKFNLVVSYGADVRRVDYVKGFTVSESQGVTDWDLLRSQIDRALGNLEVAHEMRLRLQAHKDRYRQNLFLASLFSEPLREVPMRGWNVASKG